MPIIGIDVSKHKLHSAYLVDAQRGKVHTKAASNDASGYQQLLTWAQRQTGQGPEALHVILEATGVYHEAPAEAFYKAGARVSVVNPAQVHHFARSRGIHTKNDAHDRRVLALYGAERAPQAWQPMSPELKRLRSLLARLEALEQDIQRESNRREQARTRGESEVLASIATVVATLEQEHARLRREIDNHIDAHPQLRHDRELLESVPGIGEKLGPHLLVVLRSHDFRRASQLAAYLGLAVRQHHSGTSVHRPARLTKCGHRHLRAMLYYPALTALRYNPDILALGERLKRYGKASKARIGAAMRKLVHIAFGVFKNQTPYVPQSP